MAGSSHATLRGELDAALAEVRRLSERIVTQHKERTLSSDEIDAISREWIDANLRVVRLREALERQRGPTG